MEKVNSDSSVCLTPSSEGAALVPRPHFTDGNTEGQKGTEPKAHRLSSPRPRRGSLPGPKASFHQGLKVSVQ